MKLAKLILLILIIIINSVMISGCWNYREVNDLNIIHGAAVDKSKDKYLVTVEVLKPMGGQDMKIQADVISKEGITMFDAIRNMVLDSGKKGYWSHAKVFIIGEEVAKEGTAPVLDFLNRDAEARSDIWVLVSEDTSAGKIFQGKDKIHSTISAHLEDLLKNEKSVSKFQAVEVSKFIDDLAGEGVSATLPLVRMAKIKQEVIPRVYGTAVFKKDKMIGKLNGIETRSMILIKDKLKGGLIILKDIDDKGTNVTLEIFKDKTKVKPELKDGNIVMNIETKMDVGIAEISSQEDYISKGGREKLKKYAEGMIKSQMKDVIKKAQKEYDADIFGFGSTVYRSMPKEWKKIKGDWDTVFENLPTKIKVEVNIKGSALTSKPIKVGD